MWHKDLDYDDNLVAWCNGYKQRWALKKTDGKGIDIYSIATF